jgi:hypothetical protein
MCAVIMTIADLHEKMNDCFQLAKNPGLLDDLEEEVTDKRFNIETIKNMPMIEHIWNTYDWTTLLLDEYNPEGRAFASVANIAQLNEPDVFRPHFWQFSLLGKAVVLNVKHWTKDKDYWNESPMPVWNRVPDLKDLKPCKLGHTNSKSLLKMYDRLTDCDAYFKENGSRCPVRFKRMEKAKNHYCQRCSHKIVVQQFVKLQAAMCVSDADTAWWDGHFDNMTQTLTDSTLIALADMELPKCDRVYSDLPSFQEQMDALPSMMKRAPKGLKCKLAINGWGSKQFKDAAKGFKRSKAEFDGTREIESVVGVLRSGKGKLEYAVTWTTGKGDWIKEEDLLKCQEHIIAKDMDDPALLWFGGAAPIRDILVQEGNQRMYRASMSLFKESTGTWELIYEKQGDDCMFGTWKCQREIQNVGLQSLQFYEHVQKQKESVAPTGKTVLWDDVKHEFDKGEWIEVKEGRQWQRLELFRHKTSTKVCLWNNIESTVEGLDPSYTLNKGKMRDSHGVGIKFRSAPSKKRKVKQESESEDSEPDSEDSELFPKGYHRLWVSREYFGEDFIQKRLKKLILSVKGEPINVKNIQK